MTEFHREVGLYRYTEAHELENLAMTLWNWGIIYQRLIESIRSGNWEAIDKKSGHRALNYFWGFDSGAIELLIGKLVPEGTRVLAEHLVSAVKSGELSPFYGLPDPPEEGAEPFIRGAWILKGLREKGWLLDNVKGRIPAPEELRPEVRLLAQTQGIGSLAGSPLQE